MTLGADADTAASLILQQSGVHSGVGKLAGDAMKAQNKSQDQGHDQNQALIIACADAAAATEAGAIEPAIPLKYRATAVGNVAANAINHCCHV